LTVPRAAFLWFLVCIFFLVVGGGLYRARAQESPRAPPPREVPFLGGAFTTGQAVQRAPPKTTGLPLAGPDQARSLRLSPSRESFFRRNPEQLGSEHGPGEHADWGGGVGGSNRRSSKRLFALMAHLLQQTGFKEAFHPSLCTPAQGPLAASQPTFSGPPGISKTGLLSWKFRLCLRPAPSSGEQDR
jgi:hypothetical protein